MSWNQSNIFWIYRLSDPGKIVAGTFNYKKPLDDAPDEYMMVLNDKLYVFNHYTNTLHVYLFEGTGKHLTGYYLFDVLPATNWAKCCPPFHAVGRTWKEMMGANYAALKPGSTVSMDDLGDGLIRQIRKEPDGSEVRIDFSLKFSGNVTNLTRSSRKSASENEQAIYEWENTESKITHLKHCEIIRGGSDPNAVTTERYSLSVSKFMPLKELSLKLNMLTDLLPRNALVFDHIEKKSYPLNRAAADSAMEGRLKKMAETIETNGFLTRP